jgi:hypothetical protein
MKRSDGIKKRLMKQRMMKNDGNAGRIKLHDISNLEVLYGLAIRFTRARAKSLRRDADKLDKRKRAEPIDNNYPSQITSDDVAEIRRLRDEIRRIEAEIKRLERRTEERDIAEWDDLYASSTAMRFFADKIDAYCEEKERKEAEERASWERYRCTLFANVHPLFVLQLDFGATREQIIARHRELVKQFHPDANSGSTAGNEKLIAVNKAMNDLRAMGRV